jgi:hypothetical protein
MNGICQNCDKPFKKNRSQDPVCLECRVIHKKKIKYLITCGICYEAFVSIYPYFKYCINCYRKNKGLAKIKSSQ